MQFAVGQDEEQAFAHRLGALALGAVKFAGDELSELLGHGANRVTNGSRARGTSARAMVSRGGKAEIAMQTA